MTYSPEESDRDPEEPEDFDRDDDPLGTDTEPCPFCKRLIHDDTDICPYCGNFITHTDDDPAVRVAGPFAWVVTIIVLLALLALVFQFVFHHM